MRSRWLTGRMGGAFAEGLTILVILSGSIRSLQQHRPYPTAEARRSVPNEPGAAMLSVHVQNRGRFDTNITGDFVTRERFKPKTIANAWTFTPFDVHAPLIVELSVSFSEDRQQRRSRGVRPEGRGGVSAQAARARSTTTSTTGALSLLPRWSSLYLSIAQRRTPGLHDHGGRQPGLRVLQRCQLPVGRALGPIDLARLKPLVCGEAHRALWGATGYEIPATGELARRR